MLTVWLCAPILNTSLVNSGTLHLEPSAAVSARYLYSHTNTSDGVIVMTSGSYLSQDYDSGAGSLLNYGTIIKDDRVEGVAELSTTIQNYGSVFCGGGGLNLSSGGTNFGAIDVRAPGSITAKNFSFATNSSLLGDGALSLISCRLAGNVSSNLNLTAAQLDVYGAGLYKFRTLQARSWIRFPSNGGGEILEGLVLNNGLHGGLLRSLKQTELSFPYLPYSAEVKNGSQLELGGRSAWIGGALSVLTNSTVINDSLMEVWDKSQLNLSAGAKFINSGRLTWKAKIKAATATLNDRICTLSATDVWPDISFEDSPWHISGPVVLAPKSIVASPGAELALSGLGVTNASVQLVVSSLNVQSNLSSSGAVFHLQNGSVVGPISPWRGSASFSGSGNIRADLQFDSLGLQGVADTNDLVLNGSLLLLGSNAVLRAGATSSNGTPVFPNLSVTGLVTLAGRLEVVPPPRGTLSFHPGPITILESKLPIAGSFANVTNGAILVLTNGFRCRVYAGANSPYGLNRVVLTDFGTVFDQWRMQRFTEQELRDPMVTGQNADPDGNGYSNLAEFALAIDSRKGSADLPRIETGLDGNTYVFVRRAKDVGKLQVNIALSTKLSGWQETTLGSSSFFLSRHRAFEMEDCYQYVYLFIGKPQSLFIRLTAAGSF